MVNARESEDVAAIAGKARVMLVDDHAVVLAGLSNLIDDEPDLHVVAAVEAADDALRLIPKLRPDIVLVDITLDHGSGLDLIKQIHELRPELPLLALSMHDESLFAERALRAGAKGYIMKKQAMDQVMTAIRRVLAGELYISEKMASRMVNKLIGGTARDGRSKGESPLEVLTDREFEVFRLISQSIGPTQIAQRLGVSVKTVETHREHVKSKLGLKNGAELTRFALEWSLGHK